MSAATANANAHSKGVGSVPLRTQSNNNHQHKPTLSENMAKAKESVANSLSSSLSGNQYIKSIPESVSKAIESTKTELLSVKKSVEQFDERFHATENAKKQTERASTYLRAALDDTKASLDSLAVNTKSLFDSSAEVPTKAITRALATLSAKLEELRSLAKSYDEKYKVSESLSDVVNPARERAMKLVEEISSYMADLTQATYAQLKGVNDGLRQRILGLADTGVKVMIGAAASLDTKYDIEKKIKNFDEKYKVTQHVKELDEKYKVKENAEGLLEKAREKGKKLDVKLLDGKAGQFFEEAYSSGVKMVTEGLEKLQKDFDIAKRNSRDNLTTLAGEENKK